MDSYFGVRMPRLCRIRSGDSGDELSFPSDDDGFLVPHRVESLGPDEEIAGRVLPLQDALRVGAVVLLGEPGLGKSTEFDRLRIYAETSGLAVDGPVDGADVVDGAAFEEFIGQHLRSLPPRATSAAAEAPIARRAPERFIILDQVDESPVLQHLASYFKRALDGRDTSGLRLVLGCRTADYPPNLTAVLRNACGACHLADLAPLTRAEAAVLASSVAGIDGEVLVAAAVERGATALANVPLTLGLLCRAYLRRGSLDAPPADLFAEGVLQLLDEHDTERAMVNDDSTPSQRRAVAERIAAHLVLSGRRTIWRGPVLEAGAHDVNADAFAGGEDACESGTFPVSPKLVAATLATGLFTGRGANRLAFRHASFAAYLAASYLVRRQVPYAQLKRLFLMPVGRADQAIPVALRETAGWLAGMVGTDTRWLADADPESLVPHSPLVDSPAVRATIVAAMLRRASEVEVAEQPWARASRHLAHPDLGTQLLDVLVEPGSGPPSDWDSRARIRLAVRLARDADDPVLLDRLLRVAEDDAWDVSTRILAASSAFAADPDVASRRLGELLHRFADPTYAASVDPVGELCGGLLRMLWPRFLATEDVLPVLHRRRGITVISTMRMFWYTFAEDLPESDLGIVLRWAVDVYDRSEQTNNLSDSFDDFVDDLVDRALLADPADTHLSAVAEIVGHRLAQYKPVSMPRALDRINPDGGEPAPVCTLRRALARELIQQGVRAGTFDRAAAWNLLRPWRHRHFRRATNQRDDELPRGGRTTLLYSADFVWLFNLTTSAAAEGQDALADALAVTAALVFDPSDDESATIVFEDRTHRVWGHVGWWFEPIPIDSELARRWRERRRDDEPETESEDIAAFHQRLQQLLVQAEAGEPDAFWQLARLLQVEPDTGKGQFRQDDDLLDFPGTAVLPADHPERLTDAALRYLCVQDDHGAEWIGRGTRDWRAWAGSLAFVLLHRRDRLDELPPERWACWIYALLDSVTSFSDGGGVGRELLARAAQHAPARLATCIRHYVRAELTQSSPPVGVRYIDPTWTPQLADAFAELAAEIEAAFTATDEAPILLDSDQRRAIALNYWETMVAALLAAGDARGAELAINQLNAVTDNPVALVLAGRAGEVLLRADIGKGLAAVLAASAAQPSIGREVALATAQAHDARTLLDRRSVDELVRVYQWLSEAFPPHEDPPLKLEAHFVEPDEQVRRWRDSVPEILATLGTADAVDALTGLREAFPERQFLLYCLVRARRSAAAERWRAPEPPDIAKLLDDATRRFARTDAELLEILLEILDQIGADLPQHGDLLWNHQTNGGWRPKYEYALQAYLAHELTLRLAGRGVIVNREVMVRPTDPLTGAGDRTDLLIEATTRTRTADTTIADRVAVVIEIKGSWNKEIPTAQQTQLADRYLPAAGSSAGIYLIGWYQLDPWTTGDSRRRVAARLNTDILRAELNAQAAEIATSNGVTTVPYLLDVHLPQRSRPAAS